MKGILNKIVGDPGRSTLESRIYNALTFFTPLATVFIFPLVFIIDLSILHILSILLICSLGFYLYYLSRFRKVTAELFLIIAGLVLLSIIWVSGYGTIGYAFLFYQFLMFYSLLVLEKKLRIFFFLFIPAIVIALALIEFAGITAPKQYSSGGKRTVDFLINVSVWFVFTGFIIKIIIDNFRIERRYIDEELIVAQKLQLNLLPLELPEIPGYSIHTVYLPMEKVGGDFYDVNVSEASIDIIIADVSGHGLPGAFLSMITKIAFQYERSRGSPSEVLARVNSSVLSATVDSNFITAFYCSINRETLVMRCACAGHFPGLVYRAGSGMIEKIKPRGKPLGLFSDCGIEEIEVNLDHGDRLVLYTDGITECCSSRGALFGTGKFMDLISFFAGNSAEVFSGELINALKNHSGADFFDDDITLVVFDIKEGA